jgi:hypothetical protein
MLFTLLTSNYIHVIRLCALLFVSLVMTRYKPKHIGDTVT